MPKEPDSRNGGGNRFKFPPSPRGMSKIHTDLASSRHQGGQPGQSGKADMLRRISPLGRRVHIGIVGGGVAGMRCAEVLMQKGVKVTILEARDRLGGRLGQGTLKGGHMVDLGPNWIHGTENNPILDIATETKTVLSEWGENQRYIDSDRSVVSLELTRHAAEFAWETIAQAFKESNARFGDASSSISAQKSLADYFDEKITESCGSNQDQTTRDKERLLRKVSKFFGPFTGQPVERQSLRLFWLEECLEGDNLFCADSYAKILQQISEPVKRDATVQLKREVHVIRGKTYELTERLTPSLSHRGADITPNQAEDDQQELECDELVVTTPLGWLKQHPHAFDPPLPERLSEAIEALGYGTLDKVYITFSEAWWNEPLKHQGPSSPVTAQQNTPNVTATTTPAHQQMASELTSNKILAEDPNYPGFTTFLQPEYAHETNPSLQNQEICNLAALPGETAQPTLLFYIYDIFGKSIADAVASVAPRKLHEPASEEYMSALWPYFEPYVSQLPKYDANSPACRPLDMLATAWVNDEFAGNGSYTNFPTGLERGDEDVMVLREGLPERGIWFAGEHTAPFVALGTVTGAYWSGEAVARRILSAYGLDDQVEPSNDV